MRRPDPNFPRGILAVLGGLLVGATVLQGQPRDLAGQAAADSLLSARVEGCTVCARMTQDILPGEFIEDAHEFQCGVCHHPHVSHTAEEWMATCTSSGCHARAWNESVMHRIDPAVSDPMDAKHSPEAVATPEPLEETPVQWAALHGLRGATSDGWCCAVAPSVSCSLPSSTVPARRSRWTIVESRSAT